MDEINLKKKDRQKEIRYNFITGLILLAAFVLLLIFYPLLGR